jgi:hypothetical protein
VNAGPSLFPLVAFDVIEDAVADAALEQWGHWLGGCNRPFGRQSFGLFVADELVSVAVSASTVNAVCGGWPRQSVVELARQASKERHSPYTRVCVRLWRQFAPKCWAAKYWPVAALVSYANRSRHLGDIYRFDGWQKVEDVPGGVAGGGWQRGKTYEPKSVWVYRLER